MLATTDIQMTLRGQIVEFNHLIVALGDITRPLPCHVSSEGRDKTVRHNAAFSMCGCPCWIQTRYSQCTAPHTQVMKALNAEVCFNTGQGVIPEFSSWRKAAGGMSSLHPMIGLYVHLFPLSTHSSIFVNVPWLCLCVKSIFTHVILWCMKDISVNSGMPDTFVFCGILRCYWIICQNMESDYSSSSETSETLPPTGKLAYITMSCCHQICPCFKWLKMVTHIALRGFGVISAWLII